MQSRYYDPELGRFINADTFASTGQGFVGNNMFAYCNNNSVNYSDSSGQLPIRNTVYINDGAKAKREPRARATRDVTDEIISALERTSIRANLTRAIVNTTLATSPLKVGLYVEFYNLVNHEAPWDIKREMPWQETIGTPFPGFDEEVGFLGTTMTPEMLGNFAYGYLGYNYGISYELLIVGSYYAAGFPAEGPPLRNEIWDWKYITIGYEYARTGSLRED